jgi:hypothetical protein
MTVTPHRPFHPGPFRHRVGARPLAPEAWFEIDDPAAWNAELADKDRLLAERHPLVMAALPGSEHAAGEVLAAVTDWLVRHGPPHAVPVTPPPGIHPLEAAARLVPDDLVLMEPVGPGGALVVTAGCVCFPSRWDLRSKLGRTMREVHEPVPRLNDELGTTVDDVIARLTPGRPLWRTGWTLDDEPDAHQPMVGDSRAFVSGRRAPLDTDTVATTVALRVERETLSRMPGGAVLFTIRTHRTPLGVLADEPGAVERLAAAIAALPDDVAAYKSLAEARAPVTAWLARRG